MSTPGQRVSAGFSEFPLHLFARASRSQGTDLSRNLRSSGNLLKPSLDIILFTSQLSRSLGVRGTVLLFLNYYVTVRILRYVSGLETYVCAHFGILGPLLLLLGASQQLRLAWKANTAVVWAVLAEKARKSREYHLTLPLSKFALTKTHLVRFYDGGGREKDILTRAYLRLIKHVNSIYKVWKFLPDPSPSRFKVAEFHP